jgi:hypothetical protein
MINRDVVSGVGKDSKRTDLNPSSLVSERVKRLQRDAKVQNAAGGTYGQARQLQDIASGASTVQPETIVNPSPVNTITTGVRVTPVRELQGDGSPITDGAGGDTAGAGPEVLQQPVDAPDNAAIFARAMYSANPTPQNRRLLEAFIQEGRNV